MQSLRAKGCSPERAPERSGTPSPVNPVANATEPALRASSATPRTADIAAVYDCWRTERSKSNRRYDQISPARRAKIVTRLREFTVDELCQAIRCVALDPWPERVRHDDLVVILRSREQVERFLSFTESSQVVARPEPLRFGRGVTARMVLQQPRQLQVGT